MNSEKGMNKNLNLSNCSPKKASLETTSEHLGINLEGFLRIPVVHDATALLLFDRSRQLKVLCANVTEHMSTLFSTITAVVPGTAERFQLQVNTLVAG